MTAVRALVFWKTVPGIGYSVGFSLRYRAWLIVNTGSNQAGLALAAVRAAFTCDAGAPEAISVRASEAACLTRWPSTPTVTCGAWVVSDAPPAPRIAARAGQVVWSASRPPGLSCGAMAAGVQLTCQFPDRWTSRSTVLIVTVPMPAMARRWVTGSAAVVPLAFSRPAL